MSRNFTGVNADNINLGDLANAKFDKNVAWTVAAFIRIEVLTGDERCVISKFVADARDQYIFTSDPTAPHGMKIHHSGTTFEGSFAISADTWYLVAGESDGGGTTDDMGLIVIGMDSTVHENSRFTPNASDATNNVADIVIGGRDPGQGGDNMDGDIAHVIYVDAELTQGDLLQYLHRPALMAAAWAAEHGVQFYLPIIGGSPEPDWSGKLNNGTVNGTTVSDMPPVAWNYGFDFGWQGAFTAAVVNPAFLFERRRFADIPLVVRN